MERIRLHDLEFVPMIGANEITRRVKEMGADITAAYAGQNPLFIGVLNGAFIFAADLFRQFKGDAEITFVKLASYHGTSSTGEVQTILGVDADVKGRPLIIAEDIIDSGRTLSYFMEQLRYLEPSTVEVAALLRKPDVVQFPIDARWIGFDIPNQFVVGFGLDYNGLGRNLPEIYRLADSKIHFG